MNVDLVALFVLDYTYSISTFVDIAFRCHPQFLDYTYSISTFVDLYGSSKLVSSRLHLFDFYFCR